MDENEKKTTAPSDTPQTDGADGGKPIGEELEELRGLLQSELDKAKQDAQSEQPLAPPVRDWDNLTDDAGADIELEAPALPEQPEEEASIPPEELCSICGKRPRDTTVAPDYEYCAECRAAMKKYPIHWSIVPLLLAVVACVVLAGYTLVNSLPQFKLMLKGDELAAQNKVYQALDSYNEAYTGGLRNNHVVNKILKLYFDHGYVGNVGSMISQMYTDEELDKFYNRSVREMRDAAAAINATADAAEQLLNPYAQSAPADIPYDDLLAQIDALADTDEVTYDPAIKAYYKYIAARLAEQPVDVQLGFLEEVKKQKPAYSWLYLTGIAECHTLAGRYEEALAACDEMLRHNAEDGYAVAQKAVVYRRMGDFDKALAACEEGIALSENNAESYRQQAIVYLLQGKNDEALAAASTAYDTSLDVGTANTLALCYHITGDTAGYDQINTMLTSYDLTMSEQVTGYKDGKLTLEDIFMTGKGDVV